MMPPPRRFSAAPMLTCPHRNKSSSHSSSSLHHAYSIDSSESMITVVPANRAPFGAFGASGGSEFKRSSRGSITGQLQSPGAGTAMAGSLAFGQAAEQYGGPSCHAAPRSPMSPRSPRSPSRLSPLGQLTPSGEPQGPLPVAPAGAFPSANTSTATTCSSSAAAAPAPAATAAAATSTTIALTVGQQQQQQHTMRWVLESGNRQQQQQQPPGSPFEALPLQQQQACFFMSSSLSGNGAFQLAGPPMGTAGGQVNEEDSSLAVENGTSFSSSRNELDKLDELASPGDEELAAGAELSGAVSPRVELNSLQEGGPADKPPDDDQNYHQLLQQHRGSTLATTFDVTTTIDPNQPIVCETINDFCARHSREELEYLVGQIDGLRISDCYFSERNSTLCMVIEIFHKDDPASGQ